MIDWLMRWKREDNKYAERRTLYSRCRNYKIEESYIRYGRGTDKRGELLGYPKSYRVLVNRMAGGWYIISEHRTEAAARKHIEYFAEHGRPKPKAMPKSKKRQKAKRQANKAKKAGESI